MSFPAREGAALFNGARLRLAREYRGWHHQRLAERCGINPVSISMYETGIDRPDRVTIAKLGLALGIPVGFFSLPRAPVNIPALVFLRSRSDGHAERHRALAFGGLVEDFVAQLGAFVRLPAVAFPHAMVSRYASRGDLEGVAGECRELMGVPPGPVSNMVGLLERFGAVVVSLPSDRTAVGSFVFSTGRPFVFMNTGLSSSLLMSEPSDPAQVRVDAAHELGHIIAHHHPDPGNQTLERQAGMFAEAFLLPASSIVEELPRSVNWEQLAQLRHKWGVPIRTLLARSNTLGVLSETVLKKRLAVLNTRTDRILFGQYPPGSREQPRLLSRCVAAMEQRGSSVESMANRSCLPTGIVRSMVD